MSKRRFVIFRASFAPLKCSSPGLDIIFWNANNILENSKDRSEVDKCRKTFEEWKKWIFGLLLAKLGDWKDKIIDFDAFHSKIIEEIKFMDVEG
jgi:hypothetical protein